MARQPTDRERSAAKTRDRRARPAVLYPFRPLPPPPALVLSYDLIDALLPRCDPGEWKLICAILRHQDAPTMSVSQLMAWTGIASRDGVHQALVRCLKKGYLRREPAGTSYVYRPNPDLAIPID